MEEGAQDLPAGMSTEQSESLKPFSDAQLLGELEKRLGSNPNVDPVIVQKLQSITTELQKKAEVAGSLPDEPEKNVEEIVPVVDSKPEKSSENEGKKWAEIIRKEGAGIVRGKFMKSWTFINPQGEEEQVSDQEGPFTGGGGFGNTKLTLTATNKSLKSISLNAFRSMSTELTAYNTLIIDGCINDPSIKVFTYFVPVSNAPDNRGYVITIRFSFALSNERALQLVNQMKDKADLVEDIFQNVYPGLTGKGKVERFVVYKMNLIDNITTGQRETWMSENRRKRNRKEKPDYETVELSSRSRMLNFSKPVGEIAS